MLPLDQERFTTMLTNWYTRVKGRFKARPILLKRAEGRNLLFGLRGKMWFFVALDNTNPRPEQTVQTCHRLLQPAFIRLDACKNSGLPAALFQKISDPSFYRLVAFYHGRHQESEN